MQFIIYRHSAPSKWSATSQLRIHYTCHPVPRKSKMVTRQKAAYHHTTHNNITRHQAMAQHHMIQNNNNVTQHMGLRNYNDSHHTISRSSGNHHRHSPRGGLYKKGLPRTLDTFSPSKDLYTFLSAYLRLLWQRRGLVCKTVKHIETSHLNNLTNNLFYL